jgi:cytochrome c peroxidase
MHDGSLASLRDVVEFYNRGGLANPWRSARLGPLGLSSQEVDDLVAFLNALDSDRPADVAPRHFPR